jgi:hypothetical protein
MYGVYVMYVGMALTQTQAAGTKRFRFLKP